MDNKGKQKVYAQTGARVYYDRGRRSWIALWLEAGQEHKIYFHKSRTAIEVIEAIKEKRLASYTFSS